MKTKEDYINFLKSKQQIYKNSGFDCNITNKYPFQFQKDIIEWAIKKGKAALFLDTGLGKTLCQIVWADEICKHTNGNVLILAPLAVSRQTVMEGEKFGVCVNICRTQEDVKSGINITNYEMLEHFVPSEFVGIVLDESSIIKSFSGKTTTSMIELFAKTPYKLACTATPAPNDYEELGNHAEFLGVCSRKEMLAEFFVHDMKDTATWRLKGHAETEFWKWIASWGMVVKNPADLGYDGDKYILPKLNTFLHYVKSPVPVETLIAKPVESLSERRDARKESINLKIDKINELIKDMDNCLIWCDFNDESAAISGIENVVEVKGSDTNEHKENALLGFAKGDIKFLCTKPKIAGFGMNWQNCCNMIFCGLSDSYERYYQAIRRCYRFGQKKEVNVHIVLSERECSVWDNINRKSEKSKHMSDEMVKLTSDVLKNEIKHTTRQKNEYKANKKMIIPAWIKEELA